MGFGHPAVSARRIPGRFEREERRTMLMRQERDISLQKVIRDRYGRFGRIANEAYATAMSGRAAKPRRNERRSDMPPFLE